MANWTEADLQRQLHRADSLGWTDFFTAAATANDFTVEFVMAIASRETNMQNIKGDFHDGAFHGFGIMQIDVGTDPAFCASWTPDQVEGSITRGVDILVEKRNSLAAKDITDEQAIAAAYNTGAGNVIRSIAANADPDRTTTGHDYGADVLARKAVFVKLRSAVSAP